MPTLTHKQASAALAILVLLVLFVGGTFLRNRATEHAPTSMVGGAPFAASLSHTPSPTPPEPAAPLPSAALPVTPVPARAPIVVHVVGCVKQPGVFAFEAGARVYDAVKRAGGPTPEADLEAVNLAARLEDGVQVYVPRKQAPSKQKSAATAQEERAPAPAGRLPLTRPADSSAERAIGTGSGSETQSASGKIAKITSPSQGRVNINKADERELQRLPWVGPATARKIIEYRQANGPFQSVDELLEIPGIGPKRLEDIRKVAEL